MDVTVSDALWDVFEEYDRAIKIHGQWPADPIHGAAIIAEEVGELVQACLQAHYEPGALTLDDARREAVQVAVTALRFLVATAETGGEA